MTGWVFMAHPAGADPVRAQPEARGSHQIRMLHQESLICAPNVSPLEDTGGTTWRSVTISTRLLLNTLSILGLGFFAKQDSLNNWCESYTAFLAGIVFTMM